MSQENVDIVRRTVEAFNSGELSQILALTHPAFVAEIPPDVSAEPDVYRGEDGIRRYLSSFQDVMEDIGFEAERLWDAGDSTVVALRLTARGRETAIAVEQRTVGVWTVQDGRVIRIQTYATRAEALAAVGLQEQRDRS
jgi:ketosteroid isomerase-like protein